MKWLKPVWTFLTLIVIAMAVWTNYLCWGERLLTVSTGLGAFAAVSYRPLTVLGFAMIIVTVGMWMRRKNTK